LGIVWAVAAIILVIVTIPVVIVTAIIAALVVALPFLLFVGIFSTFLGGYLPWIAGGLFVAPLFFTLAFSPWLLLGSWQRVYTSTVWTLTYREIKALPTLAVTPQVQPAGD
jgi:Zn-dependent protease with chaperone function